MLRRVVELGIDHIDTSDYYGPWVVNELIAEALLAGVAARRGVSQAQVSLAWLLRRSPNVLLIPGTSSPAHLEENAGAGRVELSDGEVAELDAAGGHTT